MRPNGHGDRPTSQMDPHSPRRSATPPAAPAPPPRQYRVRRPARHPTQNLRSTEMKRCDVPTLTLSLMRPLDQKSAVVDLRNVLDEALPEAFLALGPPWVPDHEWEQKTRPTVKHHEPGSSGFAATDVSQPPTDASQPLKSSAPPSSFQMISVVGFLASSEARLTEERLSEGRQYRKRTALRSSFKHTRSSFSSSEVFIQSEEIKISFQEEIKTSFLESSGGAAARDGGGGCKTGDFGGDGGEEGGDADSSDAGEGDGGGDTIQVMLTGKYDLLAEIEKRLKPDNTEAIRALKLKESGTELKLVPVKDMSEREYQSMMRVSDSQTESIFTRRQRQIEQEWQVADDDQDLQPLPLLDLIRAFFRIPAVVFLQRTIFRVATVVVCTPIWSSNLRLADALVLTFSGLIPGQISSASSVYRPRSKCIRGCGKTRPAFPSSYLWKACSISSR